MLCPRPPRGLIHRYCQMTLLLPILPWHWRFQFSDIGDFRWKLEPTIKLINWVHSKNSLWALRLKVITRALDTRYSKAECLFVAFFYQHQVKASFSLKYAGQQHLMRNHIGFCLPASVLIRRKLQYQVGSSDMINQWFRINFLKKYDRKWTKFLPCKNWPTCT